MDRFFVIQFLFFAVWAAALLYYPPLSGGVLVPVASPAPGSPRPPGLRPPGPPPVVRPPGAAPHGQFAQPVPPAPPAPLATPASAAPAAPAAAGGKQGANGEWVEDATYAREVATSTARPIAMLFTGSDWCSWCKKLEGEVLSKPEFREFAAAKLVLHKLDFPRAIPQDDARKRANGQLRTQFQVRGFPTVVLTDASGRELGRTGYVQGGPAAFIAELEKSLGR